jgi:hypothetical protein
MSSPRHQSRRAFCSAAIASAVATQLPGFAQTGPSGSPTHPNVAAIDHDRILAAAAPLLTQALTPITSLVAPRSPGTPHEFYSEPEDFFPVPASPAAPWTQHRTSPTNPNAFTAHREAVYKLGVTVATLTAAFVLTTERRYASKAAEHLLAWFVDPATRMTPSLQFGQHIPGTPGLRFEGIVETVPLAEVAHSLRFLAISDALAPEALKAVRGWFSEYLQWMNDSRTGGLARDAKDHHGSSWLFQCAAYADAIATGFTSDDAGLAALRHRFRTATLRAQINALGNFPHEVSTATPYRDSLFNLDLLALACDLLSTRFEDAWQFELQDGPGMRSAIAYHYPYILNRSAWPYPADAAHFADLPGRRVSLLLAARVYSRPEYASLWTSLKPLPETAPAELLRSFPISQPLLWVSRPKSAV